MGHSGGDCGSPECQERPASCAFREERRLYQELGQLGIHVIYQAKKLATFCLCPSSLSEAGFKRNGLLVISRQDGIQTTYHGYRLLLIQVPGEKVQKRSRKYMKNVQFLKEKA